MGRAVLFAAVYVLLALIAVAMTAFVQFRGNLSLWQEACVGQVDTTVTLATQARAVIAMAVLSIGPLLVVQRMVPAITRTALAPALLLAGAVVIEGVSLLQGLEPQTAPCQLGVLIDHAGFAPITAFLFLAAAVAHLAVAWRGARAIGAQAG